MKKRHGEIILWIAVALIGAVLIIAAVALLLLQIRSAALREDTSAVLREEKFQQPVSVNGIEVVTQEVSCGYAVLEMFAAWSGHDVTEESLYETYGKNPYLHSVDRTRDYTL